MLADGETMSADLESAGKLSLNLLTKEWMAYGLNLWLTQDATLFLETGKEAYSFTTTSSGDHVTPSYTETTLSAAAVTSATSLTVTSITGISNGDYIGIYLDAGTIHWDTVNGAPSGSTVTITTGLASAAASGNALYVYTNKLVRPLRIISARRKRSGIETIITLEGNKEFHEHADKSQNGTVTMAYYDPQITTGKFYVWQPSDNETTTLKLTVQRMVEDFDSSTDNADYPVEWSNAIIWNLAEQLGVEYGIDNEIYKRVQLKAYESKKTVMDFDREMEPVDFLPGD